MRSLKPPPWISSAVVGAGVGGAITTMVLTSRPSPKFFNAEKDSYSETPESGNHGSPLKRPGSIKNPNLRRSTSIMIRDSRHTRLKSGIMAEKTGILVHGCHLQADSWEEIVWGANGKMGRLPHAVQVALEEEAELLQLGTGASVASDGRLEGQFTLDFLLERLDRLHEFEALQAVPLPELAALVKRIAVAECESQNTVQEVQAAYKAFVAHDITRGFLVSSPTHLPRCLACACVVGDQDGGFKGELYASPSETSYHDFDASDVVVVEPPHRGDRDKSFDRLPFHEMVRRTYKVAQNRRMNFLQDFDELLKRYDV